MMERIEINIFDWNLKRVLSILTASSRRRSEPNPVRRFVRCACKPLLLNKRLDQDDSVTVTTSANRPKDGAAPGPGSSSQDVAPLQRAKSESGYCWSTVADSAPAVAAPSR